MPTWELYLIRHGIAAERGDAYPDDRKRPLTTEGKTRLRKQAKGLEALGVTIDVVLASPLVRTRQTAEIVAAGLKSQPAVTLVDALAPDATTDDVLKELGKHTKRKAIALVGHEPNLGDLAARLIGARRPIEFKKGGVCRIDVDALPPTEPGLLRAFLSPRALRLLA